MQPKKSDYNVSGKKYHVSLQSICFILSLFFRLLSLLFFSPPYHALPFSLKVSHSLTTLVLPLVQPNLVFSPHLFVSLAHFAPFLVLKPLTHIQLALILALKFVPPTNPAPPPFLKLASTRPSLFSDPEPNSILNTKVSIC